MGARGKQSAASMTVVPSADVVATPRPKPPFDLTDDQAHEWRAVVNRMPADWFPRETHPMLIHYCRHIVTARHVAGMIDNYLNDGEETKSIDSYNKLLIMQEREGRAMSALATRMRISQQAQYNRKRQTDIKTESPPWE